MKLIQLLALGAVLSLTAACKDESKAKDDTRPTVQSNTASTKAKDKAARSDAYFVCQVETSKVAYFSEMVQGPANATDASMAADFLKKVESLDRVRYPLPEGETPEASCESGTDVRAMASYSMGLLNSSLEQGRPFRSITDWKP